MTQHDKKRMLIAVPLDFREDFREHFSIRGFTTRFARSRSFLMSQLQQALDTDLPYHIIILDVTFGELDFDEVLAFLHKNPAMRETKLVVAAPDQQRDDAEIVLSLGAHESILYSDLDSFELTASGKLKRSAADRPDVLVVDDDPASIKVITFFLQKEGCTFDCANSGKEALRLHAARLYDAVFLDLKMPGIDGFEFARLVREAEEGMVHIPIIAVTALEEEKSKSRCLELGMDEFIPKPISAMLLRQALKKFVVKADDES